VYKKEQKTKKKNKKQNKTKKIPAIVLSTRQYDAISGEYIQQVTQNFHGAH